MSEIHVKSPELKDRELSTYKLTAQITAGNAVTDSIDISGITIAASGATLTVSGFEATSDLALDSDREGGAVILAAGTVVGMTATEVGALNVSSASVSGTAGSRILTITLAAGAGAVDFSTDSLTDSVIELTLPVKNKDY